MTRAEVRAVVASIGLPYAYYQWHDDDPDKPAGPPFLCFYYPDADPFFADGENYVNVDGFVLEHYSDEPDFAADARIGRILNANGITYVPSQDFISDQRMWRTTFRAGVTIEESEG